MDVPQELSCVRFNAHNVFICKCFVQYLQFSWLVSFIGWTFVLHYTNSATVCGVGCMMLLKCEDRIKFHFTLHPKRHFRIKVIAQCPQPNRLFHERRRGERRKRRRRKCLLSCASIKRHISLSMRSSRFRFPFLIVAGDWFSSPSSVLLLFIDSHQHYRHFGVR